MRVGSVGHLRLFCCFSSSSPVLPRESLVALSGNEHEPPCFAASVPSRPCLLLLGWFFSVIAKQTTCTQILVLLSFGGKLVQNNHYSNEFIRLFIKPWLGACSEQAAENHVKTPAWRNPIESRQMLNKQTDTERIVFQVVPTCPAGNKQAVGASDWWEKIFIEWSDSDWGPEDGEGARRATVRAVLRVQGAQRRRWARRLRTSEKWGLTRGVTLIDSPGPRGLC